MGEKEWLARNEVAPASLYDQLAYKILRLRLHRELQSPLVPQSRPWGPAENKPPGLSSWSGQASDSNHDFTNTRRLPLQATILHPHCEILSLPPRFG